MLILQTNKHKNEKIAKEQEKYSDLTWKPKGFLFENWSLRRGDRLRGVFATGGLTAVVTEKKGLKVLSIS